MARQRKESVAVKEAWPQIVEGRHSRFIFNEDGSFEHHIDWDRLGEEINQAIADYDKHKSITKTEVSTISNGNTSGPEASKVSKNVKKTKAKKASK
jgi:hypothetical protein